MIHRGLVVTLLLFCRVSFSWAVEKEEIGVSSNDLPGQSHKVKTIFKKSESHKFSGQKLKGQLKKPEISYIYQRKGLRKERIVNVPENFDEEITSGASKF
ncbi:MAG: hypothetical protein AB7F43_06615 [Bacteriovoracia bacterium]